MLLDWLLSRTIRTGTLHVLDPRGRMRAYGDGEAPRCTVRVHDRAFEWTAVLNPSLRVGEAYMDGRMTVEEGSIRDFLDVALRNYHHLLAHPAVRLALTAQRHGHRLKTSNPVGKARRNVAHHYDLSGELYDYYLDRDRQYSCAYFEHPDDDLDSAQQYKKRHIAAKLLLDRPGLRVLDIGSGWGGLALYIAGLGDFRVTGVTLGTEQHGESRRRAEEAGLAGRCRFELKDYRQDEGRYDRVVSVGMFEHVGRGNYDEFFCKVRDLLAEDGVCLLHSIGSFVPPGPTSPFIRKYIFPGGDIPSLSEALAAVERSGLVVTDIEILRLHYAETLRRWFERFQANRDKIAALYDERFCRMWEMYLAGSEMSFRHQGLMVFQMQLARRQDAVPLTRDYITDWERGRLAAAGKAAE